MRYVNYKSSTVYMIRFYNGGKPLHDVFNDIFVVSNYESDYDIKQLIKFKVDCSIDLILDECQNLKREDIGYKVFINRYYLNNSFREWHN